MTKRLWVAFIVSILLVSYGLAVGKDLHLFLPETGHLGVRIRDIRSEDVSKLSLARERGVYIEGVDDGSPAEKAGLREGDVILEYDGVLVLSVRQFQRLVSETPPGRNVEMDLWRDGRTISVTAELGDKGADLSWFGLHPGIQVGRQLVPDLDHPFRPGEVFRFESGRPRLGIEGASLSKQMAEFLGIPGKEGVLILEVLPGTPAERAGLKAGDVILSVGRRAVDDPAGLRRSLARGENELEIARDKKIQRVQVRLSPSESEEAERL